LRERLLPKGLLAKGLLAKGLLAKGLLAKRLLPKGLLAKRLPEKLLPERLPHAAVEVRVLTVSCIERRCRISLGALCQMLRELMERNADLLSDGALLLRDASLHGNLLSQMPEQRDDLRCARVSVRSITAVYAGLPKQSRAEAGTHLRPACSLQTGKKLRHQSLRGILRKV
jgi:hypothetical protein